MYNQFKQFRIVSSLGAVSSFGVLFAYFHSKKKALLVEAHSEPNNLSQRLSDSGGVLIQEDGSKFIKSVCSCHVNKQLSNITYNRDYQKVVPKVFQLLNKTKEEFACPGLSFGIFHNGKLVMKGGIGYADIENEILCTNESIFRIASISKSLTSIAIGKLIEKGLLDLDAPIKSYIKDFPEKKFNNKSVTITTRQLLSHTSGIRGYFDGEDYKDDSADNKSKLKRAIEISKYGDPPKNSDENYFAEHYNNVKDGLQLFINDPLIYEPGKDYEYSSVAYSLVSRIIENLTDQSFINHMEKICSELDMNSTVVDLNDPLILGRTRNYDRNKKHQIKNTKYVDNSYKWSGGGFLSNIDDLLSFGDNIIQSYHSSTGYLNAETVKTLWEVNPVTKGKYSKKYPNNCYALGWSIKPKDKNRPFTAYHTGGAVGASSILMLVPSDYYKSEQSSKNISQNNFVVAIIVNMQSVSLYKTANKILDILNDELMYK